MRDLRGDLDLHTICQRVVNQPSHQRTPLRDHDAVFLKVFPPNRLTGTEGVRHRIDDQYQGLFLEVHYINFGGPERAVGTQDPNFGTSGTHSFSHLIGRERRFNVDGH